MLSTVVNELLENAVKFSSDKSIPADLTVREYAERMTTVSRNVASPSQAAAFGDAVARLVHRDPELMFAARVASPPETGSAGIGLIMLRKLVLLAKDKSTPLQMVASEAIPWQKKTLASLRAISPGLTIGLR